MGIIRSGFGTQTAGNLLTSVKTMWSKREHQRMFDGTVSESCLCKTSHGLRSQSYNDSRIFTSHGNMKTSCIFILFICIAHSYGKKPGDTL